MARATRWYLWTWCTLLALLALNVAALAVPLGAVSGPLLHLGLATFQALLIMTMMMHVRGGGSTIPFTAAVGFVWLCLLFALTLSDYRSRPRDVGVGRMFTLPVPEAPAP